MNEQHKKIKGYRDLSQEEIDLMNDVKALGERLGMMMAGLKESPETDKRWVAEANTDLQKGIMCAVRSIAKPESF